MKQLILFGIFLLTITGCKNTKLETKNVESLPQGEIILPMTNSKESMNKPYVVLVSIDGFRYDYAEKYGASNLLSFDVSARKMIPSFPSKTFPNHYTIVSGLYPGHNGLVSNEFYNPDLQEMYAIRDRNAVENGSYYKGVPLWVLASQNQMVSASMFWVGSEAPIQNTYPNYYFKYNGSVSYTKRVNQTIKWLQMPAETRPHFITLYFSITDDVGHKYGPESTEMKKAVASIDATIGNLKQQLDALNLPINLIVVSDHGMIEVNRTNPIYPEDIIPKGMTVSKSFPLMVYSSNQSKIEAIYTRLKADTTRYKVYLKSNMPERFHYNMEDNRVGDLILMPKPPYTFAKHGRPIKKGTGTHGYDPEFCPEMGAIFYGDGPAFIPNAKVDSFENVDIYPLVTHILRIKYDEKSIDGNLQILNPLLK